MSLKHLLFIGLMLVSGTAMAQEVDDDNVDEEAMMQQMTLPVDTAVITGKLDNGLTYYIRHNDYPKGKVNFFIAQKVGSVQEEDDQDGLAHFLEHMAFNGSKHFPGDSLMKFVDNHGGQCNAATSSDQTVYYVMGISNERESALDSCLLILSDWSEGLSLDEDQLEEQRDVVHNEYRRMNAQRRLIDKSLPALFPDSRYGQRTTIGSMDVIDHCNSDRLRDYYHKWYYPGNQAIFIVGDIDAKKFEGKVKELFGKLPVPATAQKAEDLKIADNDTTLYFAGSDKELDQQVFITFRKDDEVPDQMKSTIPYLMMNDVRELGNIMFNNRLRKLSQKPDADYVSVVAVKMPYGLTARTRNSQLVQISPKVGKEKEALLQGLTEMKRVAEFGFNDSELKEAKEAFKAELDKQYNNRATISNYTYAMTLIDNFLNHEPYATIEQTYPIESQVVAMLPLEQVNEMVKGLFSIEPENFAIEALTQEKDGSPAITLGSLKAIVEEARKAAVTAMADTAKEEPMMTTEPKAGKIVKETANKVLGYNDLTLSNGIHVFLKKTELKANEILFMGVAPGGSAIAAKESLPMRQTFSDILGLHGLGTKNFMDLINVGQTKQTMLSDGVSNDLHWFNGQTTNENVETLMQMIYLSFQGVKKDDAMFQQMLQMYKMQINNKHNDPEAIIADSTSYYAHSQSPQFLTIDDDSLDKIDYGRCLELRSQLFANPAEMTFIFVGSLDEQSIRPLIEKYIASLPTTKQKSAVTDNRFYTDGNVDREFTIAMGNPQSVTTDFYRSGKMDYTLANKLNSDALGQVLWNKEFDIIRERESAAYTPQPSASFENDLTGSFVEINSYLETNPAKTARAVELGDSIVRAVANGGVNADDVKKAVEALEKSHTTAVQTNSYWVDVLSDYAIYGVDKHTGYEDALKAVTPETIAKTANAAVSTGNHVRVNMIATQAAK